jgi:hypothetical protein
VNSLDGSEKNVTTKHGTVAIHSHGHTPQTCFDAEILIPTSALDIDTLNQLSQVVTGLSLAKQ